MLIVALVLAVIGLAALVTAVVTSNELVAWVCIAASVLGVILLIVDAIRERQQRGDSEDSEPAPAAAESATSDAIAYSAEDTSFDADYPEAVAEEQHPDEVVSDEPESDTPGDDEPQVPAPAEEDAVHPVAEGAEGEGTEDSAEESTEETLEESTEEAEESTDEAEAADESGKR
ncbi:MAG TPA: hypothetical protein PLI79_20060 [Mycobacterium sp.]|nr:hypothetical protein [Mycobacterium sp.]